MFMFMTAVNRNVWIIWFKALTNTTLTLSCQCEGTSVKVKVCHWLWFTVIWIMFECVMFSNKKSILLNALIRPPCRKKWQRKRVGTCQSISSSESQLECWLQPPLSHTPTYFSIKLLWAHILHHHIRLVVTAKGFIVTFFFWLICQFFGSGIWIYNQGAKTWKSTLEVNTWIYYNDCSIYNVNALFQRRCEKTGSHCQDKNKEILTGHRLIGVKLRQ